MRSLILDKKTGFVAVSDVINILDSKQNPFYFFDFNGRIKRRNFNLPKGNYYISEGEFLPLEKPVKYTLKNLPKKEFLHRKNPEKWKIIFGNNPSKCTVDYANGVMLFDNYYQTAPRLVFDYILNHELGHKLYKTEKFADAFAMNRMLLKGYNPSQIRLAPQITLSEKSNYRKEFILNHFNYKSDEN